MAPPTKKLQVSTLQLRKKLEELASSAPRKTRKRRQELSPQPTAKLQTKGETKPLQLPRLSHLGWMVRFFPSLLLITEITGLVVVLYLGLINLVAPADFSRGCQGRVSGQWQTRWGVLSLHENNHGIIKGRFEYKHLDRGLVKGELTGTLTAQVLHFDWQEMQADKSVQSGRGVFVFTDDCLEFFGSTPTLGGWQGRRISP
jgi:hypothetical protein